jgi:hypothetical protein
MAANRKNLTFDVFERSAQSRIVLAGTIARFDLWEERNLGVAETSEERLRLWDETQNDGRLSAICDCPASAGNGESVHPLR